MADIFKSPRSMLGQAKRHLSNLETEVSRFSKIGAWTPVAEKDINGAGEILKIAFSDRFADQFPHIVFDCANNLRPVLDQTAFAIARTHTGLSNPRSAKFPFGPTESDMRNNLAGGCKDLPPEIRDLFAAFKPYKGGNNALWAMNELCNAPKHKLLYPIAVGSSVGLGGNFTIGSPGMTIHPRWDSENHQMIIASVPDPSQIKGQPQFNVAFTIAFDDVDEVIRGQNPITVLRAMTGEVERVLLATERECRRIGLVS